MWAAEPPVTAIGWKSRSSSTLSTMMRTLAPDLNAFVAFKLNNLVYLHYKITIASSSYHQERLDIVFVVRSDSGSLAAVCVVLIEVGVAVDAHPVHY